MGSEQPIYPCLVILVRNRTAEPFVVLASSLCSGALAQPDGISFSTGASALSPGVSNSVWRHDCLWKPLWNIGFGSLGESVVILCAPLRSRGTMSLVNHLVLAHSSSETYWGDDSEHFLNLWYHLRLGLAGVLLRRRKMDCKGQKARSDYQNQQGVLRRPPHRAQTSFRRLEPWNARGMQARLRPLFLSTAASFFSRGDPLPEDHSLPAVYQPSHTLGPTSRNSRRKNLTGPVWSWEQLRSKGFRQGAGTHSSGGGGWGVGLGGQFHQEGGVER